MRRVLTYVYTASGGLAAGFLVLTCGAVLVQVVFNLVGVLAEALVGLDINWVLLSYADFAGFFFAASAFLGLGYAHQARAHIRVSILLDRTHGPLRILLEIWCLTVSALLAGFLTYYAFFLALSSYQYGDLSVGLVAVPLWIPQSSMVLGAVVLTIALTDDLVCLVAERWRELAAGARTDWLTFPALGDARRREVAPTRLATTSHGPGGFEPSAPHSEMV